MAQVPTFLYGRFYHYILVQVAINSQENKSQGQNQSYIAQVVEHSPFQTDIGHRRGGGGGGGLS